MLDPTTATGTLTLNILAGVGVVVILTLLAWLASPLKRLIDSFQLRKIILRKHGFYFVFNPENDKKKHVTFLADGRIGEGQNNNEYSWKIKKGKLEIIAEDGKVYSRFKRDKETGKLVHTNDSDTRSVHGQFFMPCWERINNRTK